MAESCGSCAGARPRRGFESRIRHRPRLLEILVDELGIHLPEEPRLWLIAAAAITALSAAVTRIMAIPIVNDFLSRWTRFGTEPPSTARSRNP